MNKEENIVPVLSKILRHGNHPELSDVLKGSKSTLDVSSTYGTLLFVPLPTLKIYSPTKETLILKNINNEKKIENYNSVLQICPKKDNEPEVVEVSY